MVILGGGLFLMSEVPLQLPDFVFRAASERKGKNSRRFGYLCLKAKAKKLAVTTLFVPYRGTSLIRKRTSVGPYGRTMPRGLGPYLGAYDGSRGVVVS